MDGDKEREGYTVKEIQSLTMRYKFEVFYCLLFVIASLFSLLWGVRISVFLAGLGGILGVLLPLHVERVLRKMSAFVLKQEAVTQLVIGIVSLVLAVFLPFLVFLLLGINGGMAMAHRYREPRA
ncbi:MAG TPA: hypothetical protein VLG76_06195 [Rhabdochlamydiaceae bacterium]|nr:hypothetical protein [Rhabdochlamydiaceae bacterium]